MFKNIHTSDVIDIRGDVIAFERERQHYTIGHIVNICCISEKMLNQIENGGQDCFYSFAIKVQVARKIGAYLKLPDKDFLVVKEAVLFDHDSAVQSQANLPQVNLRTTVDKQETVAKNSQSIVVDQDDSSVAVSEIDKIIGIYDESSGQKGQIPFNEILIASVEPKIFTDFQAGKKVRKIGPVLLASCIGAAILLSGVFYYQEASTYGMKVLTDMGVLKKEEAVLLRVEDPSLIPPPIVVEPVQSVVQPINRSDVGR